MVSIADIEQERAAILKRVVSTILRNDISRDVFAQIIDGLPIKTTYELTVNRRFDLLSRSETSQPAKMEAQTFCDSIEMLNHLNLDSKVRNFQLFLKQLTTQVDCPTISAVANILIFLQYASSRTLCDCNS